MDNLTRRSGLILAGAMVLLALSLYVSVQFAGPTPSEVKEQQAVLREKLVWSCTYEANPLREVVQALIREEIHHARKIKPSYFPSIPPSVLHRLIHAQIRQERIQLHKAAPVDCEGVFPPE